MAALTHLRHAALFGLFALACSVSAQWSDRKLISNGGESTVATDNKGDVYITMHQPCLLFGSHDWGDSFTKIKEFQDAFCDMDVLAWPNGDVNVSYIKNGINGLGSWLSSDGGHSLEEGSAVSGSLDREWLAPNLVNNELYMDYSNGYIGGPTSIGVFLAASTDQGKSFIQRSRVDKELAGDAPVDPYLASSSDGRIYAMWSTTHDNDTIDRFDFSYSTDNGHSFTGHQTIGALSKNLGDTQERWILGCLCAFGKKEVLAVYPDYSKVEVDGKVHQPELLFYRVSTDGGVSFSAAKTVSSKEEIDANIRSFMANKHSDINVGHYVQTLPWTCVDPSGRFYIAYEDNRDGQARAGEGYCGKWHVDFATMSSIASRFGPSEQVSADVVCYRPPLDFLSCAADREHVYVSWTELADTSHALQFTGRTYLARKDIAAAKG